MIPDLTTINSKDLKKEIFSLLLTLDNDFMEDKIDDKEVYKLFHHNMCSTKKQGSDSPEDFELYDCSKESKRSYAVITNKYVLYLIKKKLEIDILNTPVLDEEYKEVIIPL